MTNSKEIQTLLNFAIQIAGEAGDIALRYFRSGVDVLDKSNGNVFDPVTKADKEIETYLRAKITDNYPGHAIIGEEQGISDGSEPYTWVIDPIDGTRGFVAGSPMWGILVGLMDEDRCVAGLMHQPFVNETYIGSGEGAFLLDGESRKRITCGSTHNISDSIMCSTHPSMFSEGRDSKIFYNLMDACRFSRFGTDCYGYALLAMGCVDLVIEAKLETYDIVPLIPVVEAAGGVVTDWEGSSAKNGGSIIACANPLLHREVLEFIEKTR